MKKGKSQKRFKRIFVVQMEYDYERTGGTGPYCMEFDSLYAAEAFVRKFSDWYFVTTQDFRDHPLRIKIEERNFRILTDFTIGTNK